MVTKNQIKLITGLHTKKHRVAEGLFIAEGVKVIQELLQSNFELEHLYTTESDFQDIAVSKKTIITQTELEKISALTTANSCLAVFKISPPAPIKEKGIILVLDDIRDPGNLGTIIRLCDWFGIEELVCSVNTVDVFNPKVIQATMGSISRVNINYVDLDSFIKNSKLPVFGTFMDGENIYGVQLPAQAIIIMGNEANGISQNMEQLVNRRIAIPRFGNNQTESLNVATATAIILSEFRRK